jgi:hypothetical protein
MSVGVGKSRLLDFYGNQLNLLNSANVGLGLEFGKQAHFKPYFMAHQLILENEPYDLGGIIGSFGFMLFL